MWEKIKALSLPLGIAFLLPLSISILQLNNLMEIWLNPQSDEYLISNMLLWLLIITNIIFLSSMLGFAKYSRQQYFFHQLCCYIQTGSWAAIFIKYFTDAGWIFLHALHQGMAGGQFSEIFQHYFGHEKWIYSLLFFLAISIQFLRELSCADNATEKRKMPLGLYTLAFLFPAAFLFTPIIASLSLFSALNTNSFIDVLTSFKWQINIFASFAVITLIMLAIREKRKETLSLSHLINFIQLNAILMALSAVFQMLANIFPYFMLEGIGSMDRFTMAFAHIKSDGSALMPTIITLLILAALRKHYKKQPFDEENSAKNTTGNFGTAAWMTEKELFEKGCYDRNTGPIIGTDAKERPLYFPLLNTLILGPPGSGKSLKYISTLLTENRATFILDIKGELCATTARFRLQSMGRKIVTLDPYKILQTPDFIDGKPDELKFEYHLNPFDYLPAEEEERDRMLTAFASSFIVTEGDGGGSSRHFDENAKILIRGYMDFMMKTIKDPSKRTLPKLYHMMCESKEDADNTFKIMQEMGGYSAAAANQILRVGSHERGSILSTTYRQIDWIGDSNIQRTLNNSNFDLRDFLKGNMDIFVILPNEQVHDKSRLVRMLLALIKALATQAAPSELPASKMLFLLDELAQFGYCQDVEQFIEVMRSYKAVLWPAFQSLDQITKIYKKADLFLGMPLKQIFTIDNLDTMKWIQSVAGKTTVNTKSLSVTAGDSRQKMQVYGGSVSNSETENVHETGIDLIKLDEIRELPLDEQLILWTGNKPLRCKKIFYYKHSIFKSKFDLNPFEK